jgi:hypothetical protein
VASIRGGGGSVKIRRQDGKLVEAEYVRHVRTLTGPPGAGNDDVDVYRLADGTEVECMSRADNGRDVPRECDPGSDHYEGHLPGE